ncbi:MAG TPA: hypothetical protein VJR89_39425 [Polyangiales bacterium]|nr:hypothetical protein [Polyangiales bacterium]
MRQLTSLFGLGTLALAACDPQLSPRYTGESLLTITGRVEISEQRSDSLVVPALGFVVPEKADILIRDVEVQGQFPSDFRLDVYEPPPRDAYFDLTYQKSGEPQLAVAYITAVPNDHPDQINTATSVNAYPQCSSASCSEGCGANGCRVLRTEYCNSDLECYAEDTYCPTVDAPLEQCNTVAVSGDPKLKGSPLQAFAGFSQNYAVLFLETPARAGSVTAAVLGSDRGVPAGYGLYSFRALTDAESAVANSCTERAEVLAAQGFNQEYGTALTSLSFDATCGPSAIAKFGDELEDLPAPFCGSENEEGEDELDAALDARDRYIERAKFELGCALRNYAVERVADPANESVSVLIGPDSSPAFFPQ